MRRWQKVSGYTRRSLIEAALSRYKRIMGQRLRSRTTLSQQTEVRIACSILNRMTELGMPDGHSGAQSTASKRCRTGSYTCRVQERMSIYQPCRRSRPSPTR